MNEKKLYPKIKAWLENYLKSLHANSTIIVEDTHNIKLSSFLENIGKYKYFPGYEAYDIKVDITGLIVQNNKVELVFVECKTKPVKLLDVGQLLGYCLVARPKYAYLISPRGFSSPLKKLISVYGRLEVLKYDENRYIKLAKWDNKRNEIDYMQILPR